MPPKRSNASKRTRKNEQQQKEDEAEYLLKMQLIELVQGYPEIYDIQDPRHHKTYLRTAAWEAISEALFIPGQLNLTFEIEIV